MLDNIEPLAIIEHVPEDGNKGSLYYTLVLDDFQMVGDYFDEIGAQGGGHTWQALIFACLKEKNPDILEKLDFDSEGDAFVVRSNNIEALQQVIQTSQALLRDRKALQEAIRLAEKSGIFE